MEKDIKSIECIGAALEQLRKSKPLIHHITNYVTVNDCANATLAIGASPIMADAIEEAADIAGISSALVLNIGTLNTSTLSSMLEAGKAANQKGIPVVFDPVGAGASPLRNRAVKEILENIKISVLRGNLSEIRFIAGLDASTKGVDASQQDIQQGDAISAANIVAKTYNCVCAVTGAVDIVSNGSRSVQMKNGHPQLSLVTGTGCMTSSLIGSFCGATKDCFISAMAGICAMSLAGEDAYKLAGSKGTGSFHIAIINALSLLNKQTIIERAEIYEA